MFQYSVLLVLTVILFLHGFFPISNNSGKVSNDPPTRVGNVSIDIEQTYQPRFKKTVLIIIDALRWDFATPDLMPKTMGHMNRKGCISKVSVESPTVTLPRIKALTTGSVSQYIDVVKNLASSEILVDSWLHSARNKGLKTIFYGDNTWEKLFPDFFTRSEGTTSFFVWDFSEVDDNVTRNVDLELKRMDWDIMILHYLGLDHIGHVLGPFSSKMPLKLKEMDSIISRIYEESNRSDTLILVTGDHGMRDGGGHGGTSHPEVTVPLIALGHNCINSSFLQTDIPANLAILLGLNIPSTSIGNLHKAFLNNLNIAEYLYALRYNLEILLKKHDLCRDVFDNSTKYHENYLLNSNTLDAYMAVELYENCSKLITRELYEASSQQDMPSLFVAVLILLNLVLKNRPNKLEMFFYFCTVSMKFFLVNADIIIIIILVILALIKLKNLPKSLQMLVTCNKMHIFLLLTCILHPLTFISTSFIEEEHYYWIFFSVTLIFLLLIEVSNDLKSYKLLVILILIRFSMDLNSTVENSVQNEDNWAHILMAEENYVYHQIFFVFGLISVFFVAFREHVLNIVTLILIFILKSSEYHNTFLGKLIWVIILFQKIFIKDFSWMQFWILSGTLLIKPFNIILIPFAILTGKYVLNQFEDITALALVSYMFSNCFYFLQGHRNSLASVDVSIGYTGLNDYYPILVVSQVLIHTYTFPVLFHLHVLQHTSDMNKQKLCWITLLLLRTSVVLSTSIVMIIFRHHLFIWSVFAPKLFIESVHTAFLFIEICFWYFYSYFRRLRDLK